MSYLDLTNDELLKEIHRVQNLMSSSHNPITLKQNRKYLDKLHKEWTLRKKYK